MRADGSGLRSLVCQPLADLSGLPDPSSPIGLTFFNNGELFPVSPDGRTVALIDLGPFDAAGHEALQSSFSSTCDPASDASSRTT